MSTYWYFECLDHTPSIRSDSEFTQHTEDVYFDHAIDLALSRPLVELETILATGTTRYFDANAREFLKRHPMCKLELVNEYGERRILPTSKFT